MLKQRHKRWTKICLASVLIGGTVFASPSVIAFQDAASLGKIETVSAVRWRLHFAAAQVETKGMMALESFDHIPFPAGSISEAFVIQDALPRMLVVRNLTTRHLKQDRLEVAGQAQANVTRSLEMAAQQPAWHDGGTPRASVQLAALTPEIVQLPINIVPMPVIPPMSELKLPDFDKKSERSLISRDKNLARERKCLAEAIYFEARGEPERGQYAVAQVVMNRVRSPYYPDTVCKVVYQNKHKRNRCQFSFACDRIPDRITNRKAWTVARRIAFEIIQEGYYLPEVGVSTHYHASYVRPRWIREMRREARIGKHLFYTVPRWTNEGV